MRKINIPVLLALFSTGAAFGAYHFHWSLHDPYFLSKDAINVDGAIPPPPARGSAAEKADFDQLEKYQSTRTTLECDRAKYEAEVSLEHLFGPKYGPLSEAEVLELSPFFDKVRNDADYFVQEIKKHFNRPRPYLVDAKLSPCAHREMTPAYPSGHAAISRVIADALSQWDPRRAAAFHARGERIAEDRVLSGVHHPADIAAGKRIGDLVFERLTHSSKFEEGLKQLPAPH